MGKPVLLLDIDGVVNAASLNPPTNIWAEGEWITTRVRTGENNWGILAAKPVLEFLRRIHFDGLAEIRWHTTWQDDAHILAEALDLPYWPVAYAPEFQLGSRWVAQAIREGLPSWWKIPAAQRVVRDEKRPLVWIDDDITWSLRKYDVDRELLLYNDALLISPDSICGVTRKQVKIINRFLELRRGIR